jgi:hypothetical protein
VLVGKASGEIGDLRDLERLSGEGDDDMKRARMDLSLIARISSYLEPVEPRAGSIGLFIQGFRPVRRAWAPSLATTCRKVPIRLLL